MYVKAVLVDPAREKVSEERFPDFLKDRNKSVSHRAVHVLPNGDRLYKLFDELGEEEQAFTLGGSAPIVGAAIVIGRRTDIGFRSAKCSASTVRTLVRFMRI